MKSIKILYGLGLLILLSSCATVKAPRGTVPSRQNLVNDAFGGYVTLAIKSGDRTLFVTGELISVEPDSINVLSGKLANSYAITHIDSARVIFFKTKTYGFEAWTALLSLGTITNGYFALFTAPLAIITGIATTAKEARRINYFDYPAHSWTFLSKYSRFPQGMPPGVSPHELSPRASPAK